MSAPAWLQLGLTEFYRAFLPKPPAGRDLLWVAFINALLIGLVALGAAANEGLLVNFADSIVGYHQGAGVPIRIQTNPVLTGHSAEVAALFNKPGGALSGYRFEPFVEIEPGSRFFKLPGDFWRAKEEQAEPQFTGWAFDIRSGLWHSFLHRNPANNDLRTLVLNKSLFAKYFDYAGYLAGLSKIIPPPALEEWRNANPDPLAMQTIFAEIPTAGHGQRISEFRVLWVESFPVQQAVAFMMPASTFRALEIGADNQTLPFPTEIIGQGDQRVTRLRLWNIDALGDHTRPLDSLQSCLLQPKKLQSAPSDLFLELAQPFPESWVRECLDRASLPPEVQPDFELMTMSGTEPKMDGVYASCRAVLAAPAVNRLLTPSAQRACEGSHLFPPFDFFTNGLVYAPDRRAIADASKDVKEAVIDGNSAMYISDLYQNSIDRFSYVIGTMDFIKWPSAALLGVVIIYALGFQILTLLGHRRPHYGVLLARGVSWYEIHAMVAVQLLLGVFLATVLALLAFEGGKLLLNAAFLHNGAARLAISTLGIEHPRLLVSLGSIHDGSSILDTFIASDRFLWVAAGLIGALNLICSVTMLYAAPVRRSTTPQQLISRS